MEYFLGIIASWILKTILQIGYLGIFGLMAIESSFVPFPSELVIPPAAYLASQGELNVFLIVIAGIAGSLAGALINYYLALTLGRKIIFALAESNWARFLLINREKVVQAEKYFLKYGALSTFFGRLVPWVRQLISLPAGFSRMALAKFLFYTGLGSGIWVVILSFLGYFFGANQARLENYYREISWFFLALAGILLAAFILKERRKKKNNKGFTLIELLVVIAIIGLLATIVLVSLNETREKARDAVRLADMKQIVIALEMYYDENGRYPSISSDGCCDGWDQGPCGSDDFIGALESAELISKVPTDPSGGSGTGCYGYNYYRYGAGGYGCDSDRGAFYVLGVRDMETSGRPHSESPGWSCPSRDWQNEFDWVTGGFES